ncbi:MAG: 50S ribosomal protein L17 [Myxococcota bacterium]
MRHHKGIKKIGRTSQHRAATLRNMATALFQHGRIHTTEAKAKALRPFAERLVTLAKRGDLHARRLAAKDIQNGDVLKTLFSDIADSAKDRNGGYTRVLKTGKRRGDNAPTALIELVDYTPSASSVDED